MAKKQLTDEQKKEIKMLQASYEMLNKTREESRMKGKEDVLPEIDDAIHDTIAQIQKIDNESAQKVSEGKKAVTSNYLEDYFMSDVTRKETPKTEVKADYYDDVETIIRSNDSQVETESAVLSNIRDYDKSSVQYDIIALPSNGECYASKISRLPVAYLTAFDENLITSPNLYKDGLIIDFLIKQKVIKEDFNVDDLCAGDADAITLFLRLTSYGTDFAVSVRDPKTGKNFDSVVDLSTIKYKDFKLKGDENGCFEFQLPLSKDVIKFKYLTRKQLKQLERLSRTEDRTKAMTMIDRNTSEVLAALSNDTVLNDGERNEIIKYVEKLKGWSAKLSDEKNATAFSRALTNKMELQIQSVNGETDRQYIHNYVANMRAKDSLELRRYINNNEPGVDFNVTIERPEEFGGGSFETFLEWDDTVFFNFS